MQARADLAAEKETHNELKMAYEKEAKAHLQSKTQATDRIGGLEKLLEELQAQLEQEQQAHFGTKKVPLLPLALVQPPLFLYAYISCGLTILVFMCDSDPPNSCATHCRC